MRVLHRTDSNMTPNPWVLSLLKSLKLRLHGQKITLRIQDKPAHSFYLGMLKSVLSPLLLSKIDTKQLKGITVKEEKDPKAPGDLLVVVDYSGYQEPNPLNLQGLRKLMKIWVKEISFNDWNTTSNIQVRWLKHGLSVRIPFESKDHEFNIKKLILVLNGQVNDFYLDIHLVPYVFWFPDLTAARDKTGKKLVNQMGWPKEYWASGRGMYKQRCAAFVGFGWSGFSPTMMDAEQQAKDTLTNMALGLASALPQETLFQLFETLILGEKPLLNYKSPSKMKWVEINPNDARFLYLDEEVEQFKGKGKITAVRKDLTSNHLVVKDKILVNRTDYKGDNIIEVEVTDETGKKVRISTLNLVESMLDKEAEIENAHPVFRKSTWGYAATTVTVPWNHLVERHLNIFGPYGKDSRGTALRYNGYLRSNPDVSPMNNLDQLPTYTYDQTKPMLGNLYDGTFFFVYPDLTAFSGLIRTLYPRRWKLPEYYDRSTKLLDDWMQT